MATTNKRTSLPQGTIINGVDTGGVMTANISCGYDQKLSTPPDGLAVPLKDKSVQFVRGSITTQDWVKAINLLLGELGTYVFYERKSGVAEATGYIKHTITNPVIHRISINFSKGNYATCDFDFECLAADETKGLKDMWTLLDDQAKPSYISAARGGYEILTAAHGAKSIYHVTGFSFGIAMPLNIAANDGDVGYTCVDCVEDNLQCSGSISFEDSSITTGALLVQDLVTAAASSLVLTVSQSQGAASKTITIAGVDFDNFSSSPSAARTGYTTHTGNFDIANSTGTPLTLDGDNKILTIA